MALNNLLFSLALHKTVIRTRDNEIVMIPNDVLGRKIIVNHMLPEQKTRIEMQVGVAYGTDLARATEILRAITREQPRILDTPTPARDRSLRSTERFGAVGVGRGSTSLFFHCPRRLTCPQTSPSARAS